MVTGKVVLHLEQEYPDYINQLFTDRHFMENIRAYNSMFAMTSLGDEVDETVNRGRDPYVLKVRRIDCILSMTMPNVNPTSLTNLFAYVN